MSQRPFDVAQGKIGTALLWILAGTSIVLLIYEAWTLIGSVLLPLLRNPLAIQTDFHYYYQAAERFSSDRSLLYLATDDVIAGFAYPPPAIVPFMAMTRLPLGVALLLLTIASYLALVLVVHRWLVYLRRNGFTSDLATRTAILLIVLASGPVYMNAIFGQVNAFVLLSAVAFVTMAEGAPIVAGASLAAGIALKIYPVLMAAMVLWNRRVARALMWTAVAGIAIVIVLLPIVPLDAYRSFLDALSTRIDKTALHITNQSLVGFIERFRVAPELFLNWTGREAVTVSPLLRGINAVVMAVAVIALWQRISARGNPAVASTAALMALVAVIAPLGWGHTYVMVLPLMVLQLINMREARPITAILIFLCV
ncbi:MAG: glycosyltransferase family 87 protein, partial [Acidobacteriota bacterium]